jgi:hypothetical protein
MQALSRRRRSVPKKLRLREVGGVDYFGTRGIHLETEPELPITVDGELVTYTLQEFSVASNALRLNESRKPPPPPVATSPRTASKQSAPAIVEDGANRQGRKVYYLQKRV